MIALNFCYPWPNDAPNSMIPRLNDILDSMTTTILWPMTLWHTLPKYNLSCRQLRLTNTGTRLLPWLSDTLLSVTPMIHRHPLIWWQSWQSNNLTAVSDTWLSNAPTHLTQWNLDSMGPLSVIPLIRNTSQEDVINACRSPILILWLINLNRK
jgi:hypothetical protein